jgi:hypothetical protein
LQNPPKFTQTGTFWLHKIPSGNPETDFSSLHQAIKMDSQKMPTLLRSKIFLFVANTLQKQSEKRRTVLHKIFISWNNLSKLSLISCKTYERDLETKVPNFQISEALKF